MKTTKATKIDRNDPINYSELFRWLGKGKSLKQMMFGMNKYRFMTPEKQRITRILFKQYKNS